MRLSVDKDDKGCSHIAFDCQVYLNGDLLNHCITADDIEGFCLVYKEGADGNLYIEPGRDYIATEVLHGDVSILCKPQINLLESENDKMA